MNFEDLKNPELQEKLKAVKTPDELVALAKSEGIDLSDEQLEAVAGGHQNLWEQTHDDDCAKFSVCWTAGF